MRRIVLTLCIILSVAVSLSTQDYFDAALNYYLDGKFMLAQKLLIRFLDENPITTNDRAYFYLGNIYFQEEKYEYALEQYRYACELNPDEPAYYINIAGAFYQLEVFTNAVSNYQRAVKKVAERELLLFPFTNFESMSFESMDTNINTEELEYLRSNTHYSSAYLHMANAYIKLGENENALVCYRAFMSNINEDYYQYKNIERIIKTISRLLGLNEKEDSQKNEESPSIEEDFEETNEENLPVNVGTTTNEERLNDEN